MPGWTTSGWYYPGPDPKQPTPRVVQPSSGASPIPHSIAALVAVVSAWAPTYDHTPYFRQRAAQIAPLTLQYGQQPPRTSRQGFNALRSAWLADNWPAQTYSDSAATRLQPQFVATGPLGVDAALNAWPPTTWGAQTQPDIAGLYPGNDPPFATRTPIVSSDPQRPIYGLSWQYGFAARAGASNAPPVPPVSNAPPGYTLSGFYAIRATWAPDTWPAQTYPDSANTPNGPVVTPYMASGPLGLDASINAWAPATWPAQDQAGPLAQPYTGDEPPGSLSVPDVQGYAVADWRAQSAPPSAGWNVPAAPSPYNPVRRLPYDVQAWWTPVTWGVQTQNDVQPLAAISYGSQPPPTSIAADIETRALWLDVIWSVQTQSDSAGIVSPPVVNTPPPTNTAAITGLRATWPDASWPAPRPITIAALLPQPVISPFIAGPAQPLAQLVGWTLAPTWGTQRVYSPLPQFITPPARINPFAAYALRLTWSDLTWAVQGPHGFTAGAQFPTYTVWGPRYRVGRFARRLFTVGRFATRNFTVSATGLSQFDSKAPDEAVKLIFDFTPDLPSGVTLSGGPTITYSVVAGTDLSPTSLQNGIPGLDPSAKLAIVPIHGGLDGVKYRIHALCATTDASLILSLSGTLSVIA